MTCPRCEELDRLLGIKQQFPPSLNVTGTHARILGMLLKRDFCAHEQLYQALWGDKTDQPDANLLRVYVAKLRIKLDPHGIRISTKWGEGYYLDAENKKKLRDLCAKAEAA